MSQNSPERPQSLPVDQYRPSPMVRLPETKVLRAKFPAIDAHNHYLQEMDLAETIDRMDTCNVRTYIDLSGWNGDRLRRRLEQVKEPYPDRFAIFYVPQFERVNEPDFGEREARDLEQAVRDGAQGLKIYKVLGLSLRDTEGKLLHVDDSRFDPLWQAAGELGVPVMIHVADPWAFFQPLDASNERYLELQRHPDWHFYGGDYPPVQQILEERDHILEKHPRTIFIGAHVGSEPEDLGSAAAKLDRYPNYYYDPSARQAELGRQPRRTREFFLRYQDRILFGTDGANYLEMWRSNFRFLETADEFFEYYMWPYHGFWYISGLDLPDDVLRKIYYRNATRVIPGIQPGEEM